MLAYACATEVNDRNRPMTDRLPSCPTTSTVLLKIAQAGRCGERRLVVAAGETDQRSAEDVEHAGRSDPICAARRISCPSPPDSAAALRLSVR